MNQGELIEVSKPVSGTSKSTTPLTPMQLVALAVESGADVDKLERLLVMQTTWEANEARKAFVLAMAEFKSNPIEIVKDKQVKFLDVNYKHAELSQITSKVGQAMSRHGLSFRWDINQSGQVIKVSCVVTHALGHSESVTLEGAADTSGKKNPIQAVGSAVSYLQRYTLMAICGLASQDQDDDGAGSDAVEMTEFEELLLVELRNAALEGEQALNNMFKALCQKHKVPAENKILSTIWIANKGPLTAAARTADKVQS